MKCTECGASVPNDVTECPHCRGSLPVDGPRELEPIEIDAARSLEEIVRTMHLLGTWEPRGPGPARSRARRGRSAPPRGGWRSGSSIPGHLVRPRRAAA
jgi:hypothetical protein